MESCTGGNSDKSVSRRFAYSRDVQTQILNTSNYKDSFLMSDSITPTTHTRSERVLVVEDDPNVGEVISRYLEREGFEAPVIKNGVEALEVQTRSGSDLVVLDLMLPGLGGLEIARQMRANGDDTPIIILTAKHSESDVVLGLGLGADDYVAKPFSPPELVARVQAVLRRKSAVPNYGGEVIRVGDLTISAATRSVVRRDEELELTSTEFDLLVHMASNPGRVYSRESLLQEVWDYSHVGDSSTVTVHVRRLRAKIEQDAARPEYIKTVWGVGYKFHHSELSVAQAGVVA